jgi:chromosome segregation ATPase
MNLTKRYISALTKKYEAQIEEAKANLALYFSGTNLAAIGEHSDLLTEHDRWVGQYADAKDKLESLNLLIEELGLKK